MQEGKANRAGIELDGFLHVIYEVSFHLFVLCLFCNCFHSLLFLVAEDLLSKSNLSYFIKSICII